MILVVGGYAAGKRSYVRTLGYADEDMSGLPDSSCPVIVDVQELVRELAGERSVAELADAIAREKEIAVFTEVGSGIVPLDAGDRAWRDRAGTLAREIAGRAESVVRVVCGIPCVVKGELPAPPEPVQVVIMRHGTTPANEKHEYAGSTDVPLSERGEAEAAAAGVCPQVAHVFVSPLQRARKTARICFPNAEQQVVNGFREMDFGDFEGRSATDMEHDEAYRAWVDGRCEGRCPNGECRADLTERVRSALERIVRDAMRRGAGRVIVVGHGGTIMAAMHALCPDGRDYFEWQVGNCEGFAARAVIADGNLVLEDPVRFADLGFLDDEPDLRKRPEPGPSFFQNRACKYFPCHEGVDEADFNCLFCYCPLYALGPGCGGDFTYTDRGRKNCTGCVLPHVRDNGAKLVASRYDQLAALASRK